MRVDRRRSLGAASFLAVLALGCSARAPSRNGEFEASFFPLIPRSHWEYVVRRGARAQDFRFVATVKQDEFVANDGRTCRIVDEQYGQLAAMAGAERLGEHDGGLGGDERVPVLYCAEGGFLHRVMSLEYRGDELEDNGLRSGELKFLPTDLADTDEWEGRTNAYRLPDGSGFVVRQLHRAAREPRPVVVPAGEFRHCVRVETTAIHYATDSGGDPIGPQVVYYYSDWYAAGVGLVKTEQRDVASALLATIELVHYAIGSTP